MIDRKIIAALALSAASLLGLASVWAGDRVRAQRPDAALQETMFIPSPHVLKRISLGYDGLLADLYWTRAVQYFGEKHIVHSLRYDLLYPLLDATVTLDPRLIVAYKFGGTFLAQPPPSGAGRPDLAVQFVERGIRENPGEWWLYYNLGFIHYFERKDYAAASDAFERGSRVPGALPFLKVMAATTRQYAGETQTARLLWSQLYQTTADVYLKKNAADHLVALDVDEIVPRLESLVAAFRAQQGRNPQSFNEMVAAGFLRSLPRDPIGDTYVLSPDGHVYVRRPAQFPFITRGLPPGQKNFAERYAIR